MNMTTPLQMLRPGFLALLIQTSLSGSLNADSTQNRNSKPETAQSLNRQDNGSLDGEIRMASRRAARWLCDQQSRHGFWSDAEHPALTALALLAIQSCRDATSSEWASNLQSGFAFLRAQIQPDGGIYKSSLSNYNTAVSLLAFSALRDPTDANTIQNARTFIINQQAAELIRPELNGGFGYGPTGVSPKRQHPDLDNTLVALEALRASEAGDPSKEKAGSQSRLNWQAAIDFISRCQNLSDTNPQPWVSKEASQRGGFVYYPGFSNAGEIVGEDQSKALRSYGSMSYAGLLSFIYADLPKGDLRIRAALDWLHSNYSLRENPGMGEQGLYYYYHLMAKALHAAGVTVFDSANHRHDWKRELSLELINRQNHEGFWVNKTGRWMEKDPVLVTSYAILTLQLILSKS